LRSIIPREGKIETDIGNSHPAIHRRASGLDDIFGLQPAYGSHVHPCICDKTIHPDRDPDIHPYHFNGFDSEGIVADRNAGNTTD
jgi:hypothetical protein